MATKYSDKASPDRVLRIAIMLILKSILSTLLSHKQDNYFFFGLTAIRIIDTAVSGRPVYKDTSHELPGRSWTELKTDFFSQAILFGEEHLV